MKYLRRFNESEKSDFEQDIKDICLEVVDIGYETEIVVPSYGNVDYVKISYPISTTPTHIELSTIKFEDVKDCALRLKGYLGSRYDNCQAHIPFPNNSWEVVELEENTKIDYEFNFLIIVYRKKVYYKSNESLSMSLTKDDIQECFLDLTDYGFTVYINIGFDFDDNYKYNTIYVTITKYKDGIADFSVNEISEVLAFSESRLKSEGFDINYIKSNIEDKVSGYYKSASEFVSIEEDDMYCVDILFMSGPIRTYSA